MEPRGVGPPGGSRRCLQPADMGAGSTLGSSGRVHLTGPSPQPQELFQWHTQACEIEEGKASKTDK